MAHPPTAPRASPRRPFRLAELVASLSLATDLGNGQPLGTALSCTLLALRLGAAHGLSDVDLEAVYWAGLLRFVGCTATSVEEARFSGDDLELRGLLLGVDFADPPDLAQRLSAGLGRSLDAVGRATAVAAFLEVGPRIAPKVLTAHCDVAVRLADRLGMPPGVLGSLDAYHERWDGGGPRGLAGEAIPPAARVLSVAQVIVANARALDAEELRAMLRGRAGGQLDPAVVQTLGHARGLALQLDDSASAWAEVIDSEPSAERSIAPERLPELARVLGDYADLKSPYVLGHSRGVAELTRGAAGRLGYAPEDMARLEVAALLHDLGRASVPNGIIDKPRPLNALERERARGHAYWTERILALSPGLAEVGRLAASSHERLDGSGVPHGLAGTALAAETRLLAVADSYQSLVEERAYRPALSRDQAARALRDGGQAGRFDARAVAAVLEVAGHGASTARAARAWPAGLTDREVEVLRLVARGLTNKEVATRLQISPRTVQQHTLHVYDKIGVSTRAAATLFAAENSLFLPS